MLFRLQSQVLLPGRVAWLFVPRFFSGPMPRDPSPRVGFDLYLASVLFRSDDMPLLFNVELRASSDEFFFTLIVRDLFCLHHGPVAKFLLCPHTTRAHSFPPLSFFFFPLDTPAPDTPFFEARGSAICAFHS